MNRFPFVNRLSSAVWFAAAAFAIVQCAHAEEGVFDREEEIRSYLGVFTNGTITEATIAASKFDDSGISDPRIASVLSQRLEKDYPRLTPRYESSAPGQVNQVLRNMPRIDWQYGVAMVRALASLGLNDSVGILSQIAKAPKNGGSQISQVRAAATKESKRIEWYRARNEIMSSKANYHQGDDIRTSMMINLLTASERTYHLYAMDRILRESMRDPRLFAVVNDQLRREMAQAKTTTNQEDVALITMKVRLLGVSGDRIYRATLNEALASKLPANVKKAAQLSLDQLK